jgi:homoprotocatechuate degradation regulator HpaR
MSGVRKIPMFERSIAAALIKAEETVLAPMRPKLREYGITEPQWRVMRVINERGATYATGLAEVALLHAPSVTRILQELEDRKFILRELDASDRRRALVTLTPEGKEIVRTISRHVARIIGEYADRFGAQRLDKLVSELRALSTAIKGVE